MSKTPEHIKAANRANHHKHKEKRNAVRLARYKADPLPHVRNRLKSQFGISLEEYGLMWQSQKGLCKICLEPESREGYRLSVDHNHETGAIRSLLCGKCNKALGGFRDSALLLQRALDYLTSAHMGDNIIGGSLL